MSPPDKPQISVRPLFAAGVVAGVGVGILDGIRAAVLGGADAAGFLLCVLLTAGLDAVVGALLGAAGALLTFLGRWGRAIRPARWARVVGWAVVGLATGGVGAGAVVGTSLRNNRFLAAGVVCLAALGAGTAGAVLGPAVARLLGRRGDSPSRAPSPLGVLVVAPLVAAALAGIVFAHVWQAHAPLRGALQTQLALVSAAAFALLPFALAWASEVGPAVSRARAVAAAALLLGGPVVAVVAVRWTRDFQYVRWSDAVVIVAIAAAGLVLARRLRLRPLAALGLSGAALVALFATGASEPARKAAARAGLVTPFLDGARAIDLDGDGYAWLLGGGDCNDRDKQINPAAQEWPDDGIDQNCDGKDASASSLRSPPLQVVPDAVPRDLNLILVTIDTLRADHLGCYGYKRQTSPALDKLAAEGTLFVNGWAHAPSTRYSMPALATGRWPSAISWQDCSGCDRAHWARIGREDVTIGEALHGLGYSTGALYAIQYFRREYARGFERGIDFYEDKRAALHVDINGDPAHAQGTSSREMADDAIAFLERQKQDHKFFLWLHFYDPHLEYARHEGAPDFGGSQLDLYDGEIWFTDHHFGRVLDRLRQLGLWDRTAVVVTGDHGEGLGEHGIPAHGYHLYPPQTKVPFIVRVPGASPRKVTTPVSHVDIAPTLLNLARGPHQPSFLGRSMVDLVMGSAAASPPGPVFQEVTYECATGFDCTRRRALVTETHHLIWNWMPDNTTECYDLRADPDELRDLWGTTAGAACQPMKSALQDMVQALSFPPKFAEKMAVGLSAPGAPAPAPSHLLEARLGDSVRFLGYDLPSPAIKRGGEVELTYHFEVLSQVPEGWRLFVHLDGPGGYRNLDHVPLDGLYPLNRWRPGQRIRDRQHIVFPTTQPPGLYTISLGFYRRNERMPVTPPQASDGKNRLRVTTIMVQ